MRGFWSKGLLTVEIVWIWRAVHY